MEKTHNERQALWDVYANKTIYNAVVPVAASYGHSFYVTQSDLKRHPSRIELLRKLVSPCADNDCDHHRLFAEAAKIYQDFYTGDAKECLVLWQESVWVCVRIGGDLMYKSVKPWDTTIIKAHARDNNLCYDMRTVEIAYAKEQHSYFDNVLVASF